MGRPPIGATAMTATERQRRRRAKLAAIVHPATVLADLSRAYGRAYASDRDIIRRGLKRLVRQWERDAARSARRWRQRMAAGRKRRKR